MYDCWAIMPKTRLDELQHTFSRGYILYSLTENMPRFKELVIADLEQKSAAKKLAYDEALADVRRAQDG